MGIRVGIVTYHNSLSYGGCLQAFATMEVLRKLECDPFFVDYENRYEARAKSFEALRHGTMKQRAAALVKRALYGQKECQRRAFSSFASSLPLSTERGCEAERFKGLSADVLLAGSDQVWNPDITDGIDPMFFLQFGHAERRISFSSSMGSCAMNADELAEVGGYLSGFSAVSVREEFAKAQIQPHVNTEVHVCADPTLLIPGDEWRRLSSAPPTYEGRRGRYILVFMVSSAPSRYAGMLHEVKEALGLPVVQVRLNTKRPPLVDEVIPATPFELVWLIDNAAHVLTDSFHGLAFSINTETPFTLLPNDGNNVRLQELARSAGLSDRMRSPEEPPCIDGSGDFATARLMLARKRGEDASWLSTALGLEGCHA